MKAPKNFNLDNVYTSPLSELENFCIDFEKYVEYIAETSSISVDDNAVKVNTKLEKSLIIYGVVKDTLKERINDPEFEAPEEYESIYDELLGLLQEIQEFQFEIQDINRHINRLNNELSELNEFESASDVERVKELENLKGKFYTYLQDTIKKVWELDIDINMKKVTINLFGLGKHLM